MTHPTPTHRSRRPARRRTAAGAVASGVLVTLAASLGVAVAGGSASAVPVGPALARAGVACQPWQTPTVVPAGVALTPRVFPADERPAAAPPVVTKPAAKPGPRPAPRPRVVCRNA